MQKLKWTFTVERESDGATKMTCYGSRKSWQLSVENMNEIMWLTGKTIKVWSGRSQAGAITIFSYYFLILNPVRRRKQQQKWVSVDTTSEPQNTRHEPDTNVSAFLTTPRMPSCFCTNYVKREGRRDGMGGACPFKAFPTSEASSDWPGIVCVSRVNHGLAEDDVHGTTSTTPDPETLITLIYYVPQSSSKLFKVYRFIKHFSRSLIRIKSIRESLVLSAANIFVLQKFQREQNHSTDILSVIYYGRCLELIPFPI